MREISERALRCARLKEMNRSRAKLAYEAQALSLDCMPRVVFVELTQDCNLGCEMCRGQNGGSLDHMMSDELFDQVADTFFDHAELVDLRGWGESVILPNFADRVERVVAAGADVRIVTNLSYRADDALKSLARCNAHIAVSLDCADEGLLARLRGGADLKLVLENLVTLREYYEEFKSDFGRVVFGITIQKDNLQEIVPLVRLAKEYGISTLRLFPRQNGGDFNLGFDEEDYVLLDTQLREAFHSAAANEITLRVGVKLYEGMKCNVPEFSFPCMKPWEFCFIGWDGHFGICDFILGPDWERFASGKIPDDDPVYLWSKGQVGIEYRKAQLERDCSCAVFNERCSWCYENRFVDFQEMFEECYGDRVLERVDFLGRG